MNLDVNALIARYAAAAVEHRDASLKGDYETANREYDVLAKLFRDLRRLGAPGDEALRSLLSHPDTRVRGWAAAHALEFAPQVAEPVLEQVQREGGLAGFSAEMTLAEWRKGKLRFP